jgi:hypothetical protein
MNFPNLAKRIDEKTIRFLGENIENLEDFVTLWEAAQNNDLTAARILERFRGDNIEKVLLKAIATESALDEVSSAKELEGIVEKLQIRAQGKKIKAIRLIPFSELSEAQKELMRAYKRE